MPLFLQRRFAVAALALAVTAAHSHAQTPVFRTGVDLIRVDATVLDANRMPVRGLTAADFTVLENGKPRPIVAFDAVDIPDPPPPAPDEAAWVQTAPRDVISNRVDERRIFLIIMDDATLPMEPHIIERAKRIATDVVSRMSDSDRAAVVFTANSGKAQPFTADRSRLLTAINAMRGGNVLSLVPEFSGLSDPMYFMGAVRTITQSVETLLATPQGRKTLVLISTGVPQNPDGGIPQLSSMNSTRGESDMQNWLREEVGTLFRRAELGHVSVYAFDPGGATGLEDYAQLYYLKYGASAQTAMLQASQYATRARDFLVDQANQTGGRAVVGTADPVAGVTQMFRESSSYYLIAFQSADTKPGRRHIEIRTSRAGVTVETRQNVELMAPAKPGKSKPVNPLVQSISGVLPEGNLPMRVSATSVAAPNGDGAMVAITLGIHQPVENVRSTEKLEVQVNAYQTDGTFVAGTRLDAQLVLRATDTGGAQFELLSKLPLKPGRYQLRIAATCPALNIRGSVFADLDVPDFAKAVVSLSNIALTMTPATASGPANAFAGLLPVVPTSHRDFIGNEHVSIFTRAYQGGKQPLVPIDISAYVENARGRRMFSRSETLTPPPGNDRSTDYAFELAIDALSRGDYLLTIEATTATGTAHRTLRFSRR